jgi:hypothetical protein
MDDEDGHSEYSEYEDDIDRIFGLSHDADNDESSDEEASESGDESSSESEGDDESSEEEETKASVSRSTVASRNASPPLPTKSPPALDVNDVLDELEDVDSISDDERDLIYSRLYHSSTTQQTMIPPKTTQQSTDLPQKSKSKRSKGTKDQLSDLASTKFTFEIDLDNVAPPPPPLPPSPPPEVHTIDSDSDDETSVSTSPQPPDSHRSSTVNEAVTLPPKTTLNPTNQSATAATNAATYSKTVPTPSAASAAP